MKAIICEMCSGHDFIKDGDFYVCQSCGTKYTIEAAKKMMVEIDGTVNVQGTVAIDNSKAIERNLQNARRAKEKEDWEEVEKYYNLVEQYDPTNIEAIFYSAYGKAKQSLVVEDVFKRQAVFKTLTKCVSMIDDNYDITHEAEDKETVRKIAEDVKSMYCSSFVYKERMGSNGIPVTNESQTWILFDYLLLEFCTSLENIAKLYENKNKAGVTFFYDLEISLLELLLTSDRRFALPRKEVVANSERIMELHRKYHAIDPSHVVPDKAPTGKKGCYVATCVYGSYDCPEVWTLRRFRDYTLAESWYGRAFIRFYYAVSPTLVKWFGHTSWFKSIWKPMLDKMVNKLNETGVADTPYSDRDW